MKGSVKNRLELSLPPPLVGAISVIIIWRMARLFPHLDFSFTGKNISALLLLFIGLVFGICGIREFRKASTTVDPTHPNNSSVLVTSGIYKISRNPMYLGLLVGLLGIALYFSNLTVVIGLLFFLFYMTKFQIQPEERILTQKFGKDYLNYKESVHRWIGYRSKKEA